MGLWRMTDDSKDEMYPLSSIETKPRVFVRKADGVGFRPRGGGLVPPVRSTERGTGGDECMVGGSGE